jgi:ATP-dependent Lhr-like helicase
VRATGRVFRSRRQVPPSAEGRWSLVGTRVTPVSPTEWSTALAQQLLTRYGVVTREVGGAESIPGGFSAVYDVLRALDESGRVRRGFFVGGVGATQFALPPALDLLRSLRQPPEEPEAVILGATDPANPYGTLLKWPSREADAAAATETGSQTGSQTPVRRGPTRTVGARVVLVDGACVAHVARGARQILTWLPEAEPERSRAARALAGVLAAVARGGEGRDGGLLVSDIDAGPAHEHTLAPFLVAAGFVRSGLGYQVRRERRPEAGTASGDDPAARPAARHA